MLRRATLLLGLFGGAGAAQAASPITIDMEAAKQLPVPMHDHGWLVEIEDTSSAISGVVKDTTKAVVIEGAIVLLSCPCLAEDQERETDADGRYSFVNLPPGIYTVRVLARKANVSKRFGLEHSTKFRVNFGIEPERYQVIDFVVGEPEPATVGPRDFTAVVDIAPIGNRRMVRAQFLWEQSLLYDGRDELFSGSFGGHEAP